MRAIILRRRISINQMDKEFVIDSLKMKWTPRSAGSKTVIAPRSRAEFVRSTEPLFDDEIAADRFELAKPLLEQMQKMGMGRKMATFKSNCWRGAAA